MTKPYTYEQAIADAPKHVKRRSDLPTEVGWKVCLDGSSFYALRWWDGSRFSLWCSQWDAVDCRLDSEALNPALIEILGWCEPWWVV